MDISLNMKHGDAKIKLFDEKTVKNEAIISIKPYSGGLDITTKVSILMI